MSAANVYRSGAGLCLTTVERALSHPSFRGCGSGRSDDGDKQRADSSCGDQQVVDLDIPDVRGNYVLDQPPSVTHSLPYVTQHHVVDDPYFQQTTSLLDFDLDCLDAVEHDPSLSETALQDPSKALPSSAAVDPLSLDCVGNVLSSRVSTAAVSDNVLEVGKRKKDASRRHKHPAGKKPATVPTTEKPIDDFSRLVDYVPDCLERFGFCVVDKFAGKSLATAVRNEVLALYEQGSFEGGLLTSQAFAMTAVRGDRVFWLEREDDGQCAGICKLIGRLDDLFLRLRGRLGSCHISSRSKAMLACYPGQGRCYRRHVDNPSLDGRAITAIYYINKAWNSQRDGGVLRMFPSQLPDNSVDVEPMLDRIVFFWSDSRTPHEVLPAYHDRYAITVWYFNDVERQQARLRYARQGNHVDNPRLTSVALLTA